MNIMTAEVFPFCWPEDCVYSVAVIQEVANGKNDNVAPVLYCTVFFECLITRNVSNVNKVTKRETQKKQLTATKLFFSR